MKQVKLSFNLFQICGVQVLTRIKMLGSFQRQLKAQSRCRANPIVDFFFLSVFLSLFPGGPVVVTVGFYLLSINSINVVDMVSIYFMNIVLLLCSSQWKTGSQWKGVFWWFLQWSELVYQEPPFFSKHCAKDNSPVLVKLSRKWPENPKYIF